MMWASAGGNRSKQLIYMVRHNSPSSFSSSNSEKFFFLCVCTCVHVRVCLVVREGTEAFVHDTFWMPHKHLPVLRMAVSRPLFSNDCTTIGNEWDMLPERDQKHHHVLWLCRSARYTRCGYKRWNRPFDGNGIPLWKQLHSSSSSSRRDFITKTKHQTLSSYYFITSISSLILTNEIFFFLKHECIVKYMTLDKWL